jgi:hypothetical protein
LRLAGCDDIIDSRNTSALSYLEFDLEEGRLDAMAAFVSVNDALCDLCQPHELGALSKD